MLENDPLLKAQGAGHTIEHPFLFNWQGKYRPSDVDRALQRQMVGYWTGMAKAGNPNGSGNLEWPVASIEGDVYLEIGATTNAKRSTATSAHCDFWDKVPMLWPHI